MMFLGVDPGAGGGLAFLFDSGTVVSVIKMPETERDILDALREHAGAETRAVIERVHSSPQMGVSSAFRFGQSYGGLRMAIIAVGIPLDDVTPQRWQAAIGGLASATDRRADGQGFKGRDKNISKARAQVLFPAVRVTHALADALMIAEYCRRLHLGMIQAPAVRAPYHRRAVSAGGLF